MCPTEDNKEKESVAAKLAASRKLLPIARLHGSHYDILTNALANVLDCQVARTTYAQILDGLPLKSVVKDVYQGEIVCPGHPLLEEEHELWPGVLNKIEELRASAPLDTFEVDASTILEYQAASPGSRAFQARLIELVARVVHAIAIWIHNTYSPLRPGDDPLMAWTPEKDDDDTLQKVFYKSGNPPTWFIHPWYTAYDQYPDGVADGVSYWAEDRILGGVVLFDRRPPEAPDTIYRTDAPDDPVELINQPDAVFFHSYAMGVTYRIYRLRDEQKQQLLQFLLAPRTTAAAAAASAAPAAPPSSSSSACPLPIRGDRENRIRIDPEEPMKETGIYRDKWERKPIFSPDATDGRIRDVIDLDNYLTREEYSAAYQRGVRLRERRWDEEDLGW